MRSRSIIAFLALCLLPPEGKRWTLTSACAFRMFRRENKPTKQPQGPAVPGWGRCH